MTSNMANALNSLPTSERNAMLNTMREPADLTGKTNKKI